MTDDDKQRVTMAEARKVAIDVFNKAEQERDGSRGTDSPFTTSLREMAYYLPACSDTIHQAADTIDRLTAENNRLTAALEAADKLADTLDSEPEDAFAALARYREVRGQQR